MQSERIEILNNIFGKPSLYGEERMYYCPSCNSSKKKLSINLAKNVFKCWVCDFSGKNVEFLVKKYGNVNHLQKWGSLSTIDMSLESNNLEDIINSFSTAVKTKEESLELPEQYSFIFNDLENNKKALNYLYSRGLDKQKIIRWKIGYCSSGVYADRIVVPSFDCSGKLNYFVTRTISNHPVRYKNPKSSKDIIFNDLMINWKEPITLVEGVFDSFNVENSIPLLGSTLNEHSGLLHKIVKHQSSVYIALDRDAFEKSLSIYKILSKYNIKTKIILLKDDRDFGDMTPSEVLDLYKEASDINSSNYLMYEIMKI